MEAKRFDSDPSPLADPSSLAQRLWALDDEFPHELREACLAAGDTLVPELIRQLEARLDATPPGWPLVYAAELLGAIGDSRAVPVLLRCLEQSDALEALHHKAVEALVNLGAPALERCLEAYAVAPRGEFRDDLACVLERFGRQDERLYEVFLDTLKRTPEIGANCLAAYGDARASRPWYSALTSCRCGMRSPHWPTGSLLNCAAPSKTRWRAYGRTGSEICAGRCPASPLCGPDG